MIKWVQGITSVGIVVFLHIYMLFWIIQLPVNDHNKIPLKALSVTKITLIHLNPANSSDAKVPKNKPSNLDEAVHRVQAITQKLLQATLNTREHA